MAEFVDISNLGRELRRFESGIARYVDQLGMNGRKVVAWRAGLLMNDIAREMLPGDKPRLEKGMLKDAKQVFQIIPDDILPPSKRGPGPTVWFEAGRRFLVGTLNWNPSLSDDAMMTTYYKYYGKLGKREENLGRRGNQYVYRVRRFCVKRTSFNKFLALQRKKIGKLKASFCKGLAEVARAGVPVKNPPLIAKRHIGDSRGAVVSNLNTEHNPSITMISRQIGCEHPMAVRIIVRLLQKHSRLMAKHIERLVRPFASGKPRQMEYLYER